MPLLVLVPSRGRPQKAVELLAAFEETKSLKDSTMLVIVDEDDRTLDDYLAVVPSGNIEVNESVGSMVKALNAAATLHAAIGVYNYIGFFGDDHRPRTKGWDKAFVNALDQNGGGLVYGDDLFQHERIPTHVVMSANIINLLGWMALPTLTHLYVDDQWRAMAEPLRKLFYMPEIVIEHIHPAAGKAEWDEGYKRVNAAEMYDHDRAAFEHWQQNGAASDIRKVAFALGCQLPSPESSVTSSLA